MTDYSWRADRAELVRRLRHRLSAQAPGVLLTLVALPGGAAYRLAPQIADQVGARYVHFDAELINALEADGWDRWVKMAEGYPLSAPASPLGFNRVWQPLCHRLAGLLDPMKPLLVGEPNLAALFRIDLAHELSKAAAGRRGHLVLAGTATVDENHVLRWNGVLPQSTLNAVLLQLYPEPETR